MKKYIYTLLILINGVSAFAQSPDWSVDENKYKQTMTFVAFLNINGITLSSTSDKVGAFVGEECRGVTTLTKANGKDTYYAYLTVLSNTTGENIKFKVYNSTTNTTHDIPKTMQFSIDKHVGNVFQAYSIASPTLSNEAKIIDFGFKGITPSDKTINDTLVSLEASEVSNINNLIADFQLSTGAKLYIDETEITSGSSTIDLSKPVKVKVMSADQSILNNYTININSGLAKFYKKDAVCYTGGAIKVIAKLEDSEVYLSKDGKIQTTQKIKNGETIFINLAVGKYTVNIGDEYKSIEINLKK